MTIAMRVLLAATLRVTIRDAHGEEQVLQQLNGNSKIKFEEQPRSLSSSSRTPRFPRSATCSSASQNGTPLNAQQKRDAVGSNAGRVAKDLADLPFFAML